MGNFFLPYQARWIKAPSRKRLMVKSPPLLALPNLRRCCIDQTGPGCQFVERAKKKFNRSRVEGPTFTAELKDRLACKPQLI
jgi:phage FluMu gp28-like protein